MYLSDDGTRAAVKLYGDFGCKPEQALRQGEVGARRERVGIRNRTGKDEAPLSREIGEQQLLISFRAQSEALRADQPGYRIDRTARHPGALCLDGNRVAEHAGLNGRALPRTHMLKGPDRHLSLAGRRRDSRRFLKEGPNLAIGAAVEPDEVVDQSAEPGVIFRSQPDGQPPRFRQSGPGCG